MTDSKPNKNIFTRFANITSNLAGHPATFIGAMAIIAVWAVTGPVFGFNDTWQLVINTGTTIITFLMVFLIQNTQNRDTRALQIKLDELIRANENAHNLLLDLEELTDAELQKIQARYERLASQARDQIKQGNRDTNRVLADFDPEKDD